MVENQQMVEEFCRSATLMSYASNSVRSHWNAEKGSLTLNFTMVDSRVKLYELLDEFKSLFVTTVNNKGINMQVSVSESVPQKLSFEREKYFQILFHLMTNSLKFARLDNPNILILLSFVKFTDVDIVSQGWQGYIKTEVIDNREGMITKNQESYFCESNNIENEKDFGLSTAQVITEALGGELEVKSANHEEATISFTTLSNFTKVQPT